MNSTAPNIDIQPVTPADLPAIAALAREIWRAAYSGIIRREQIDYMLETRYADAQLRADLRNKEKWLDQAFVDGRRVGFSGSEICAGEFKLDKLYIHPDAQRQGIGSALIAQAAARAKALGYPRLILAVNKQNAQAINAYRKHGFSVREAVTKDIGQGYVMDDYIMEKKV
jgi:ribosomal protein S18 acetylase RimI-like enzyme